MKVIKLFLFLGILSHTVVTKAQFNGDSLYYIWKDIGQADTTRLNALSDYAWDGYLYSQPDSAFYFAQMHYEFAEKKGLKQQMASALNIQGVSFKVRGEFDQALEYYQKCLKIKEELGDEQGIANSLNNIGVIHETQGDYAKALECHNQCLKVKERIGNKNGMSKSYMNIGIIYYKIGNYLAALDHYQKGLSIQREMNDKKGIANSLNNIGLIYDKQGDYTQALEYFQKSLIIKQEIENTPGIASAFSNIGMIYNGMGDYEKALEYHTNSLNLEKEIGNKQGYASSLNNIGGVYQNLKSYNTALEFYQQSLQINEEIGDKHGIVYSHNVIGLLYQTQGLSNLAISACQKGYILAQEIKSIDRQKSSCACLYEAYKSSGNTSVALEYHELMLAFDDSLNTQETSKKLQQMEFEKQVLQDSIAADKKERLIVEAHQVEVRKKNQIRNVLAVIGLFLLIIALALYARWRYVHKAKTAIEHEKDRSENLLLNILPAEIAQELKDNGRAEARDFNKVSILFTDFKGFTAASTKLSAQDLVAEINTCFEAFDGIMEKYKIEKIKTIGDAYMAAGGLPIPTDDSVQNTVLAALKMQEFITKRKADMDSQGLPAFEMRVGIHTGPVVAGIVGVKKFQYDIWGDTVNTASRMESSGEVGKVNVSHATFELLKSNTQFTFKHRGKIEVKGKGEMEMYFVNLVTEFE